MSQPKMRRFVPVALVAGLVLAGCGSDQAAAPRAQAGADGQPTFDVVQAAAMSASEHDRLLGAVFDPANRLYASGWVAAGTDQSMAVTRFRADGALDTAFGTDGVAAVNVAKGGKAVELARSVVVQGGGQVVVAGPVEHDPSASGDAAKETDIALARFDDAGRLDPGFGTGGVVRLDLSTVDTVWGLVKLSDDRLLVVGSQVGVGPGRTDADFAVVRLTADGTEDPAFGTGGTALVGVGPDVSEVPKSAVELPDGKVVVAGYATVGGVVSPVLFRLTTAGTLDPAFGDGGIAVRPVLGNVAEAYAVVLAGNRLVTTGYGKDTAEAKVDLIANGFTLDGALDRSFGTNGLARVDVAGDDDRGRNLVALPDGRTVLVGSAKTGATNLDAMVVSLTPTGQFDAAFGQGGRKLYDVGGPNDAFFGVALSSDGSRLAAVGYLGRDASGGEKDDGAVLWLRP
ncbi:MAG: hypothetical protein ACR2KK_18040 [Acidimicrobiales bacterium]